MTAKADLRVPIWIVVAVILASSDFLFSAVEGAVSLDDFSWTLVVGSSIGREEVDSNCS